MAKISLIMVYILLCKALLLQSSHYGIAHPEHNSSWSTADVTTRELTATRNIDMKLQNK